MAIGIGSDFYQDPKAKNFSLPHDNLFTFSEVDQIPLGPNSQEKSTDADHVLEKNGVVQYLSKDIGTIELKGVDTKGNPDQVPVFSILKNGSERYILVTYDGYSNAGIYLKNKLYYLNGNQAVTVDDFKNIEESTTMNGDQIKCFEETSYCVYFKPKGWTKESIPGQFISHSTEYTTYRLNHGKLNKIDTVEASGPSFPAILSDGGNKSYSLFGGLVYLLKDNSFTRVTGIDYSTIDYGTVKDSLSPSLKFINKKWFLMFGSYNNYGNGQTYLLEDSIAKPIIALTGFAGVDFTAIGTTTYVTVSNIIGGNCGGFPCKASKYFILK